MVALALLTIAIYAQVFGHEFIAFDDGTYIKNNEHVEAGLTIESIGWAFTSGGYASNWHPVTWISHMLDATVFGLHSGWHHISNVIYHVANTLLLFVFLRRVNTQVWGAAFVAAIFALHPTHVESVAWASERKDTLSTMFWLLTMLAYERYVREPSGKRYAWVAGLLAIGLMAKPMLVTLPFVLLLLDYWPLRRKGKAPGELFTEKLPLIGIAIISMIVTVVAQDKGGAVKSLDRFSFGTRVQNSLVSYGEYLWNTVAPFDLAFFYPYPPEIELWKVGASLAVIAGLLALGWRYRTSCPAILVGVLWYLGTLVPVIGIVQVGNQPLADRYTYVPLIGIYFAAAWAVQQLVRDASKQKLFAWAGGAAVLACCWLTFVQIGRWKDSETLFLHTLAVTERNYLAHNNLGQVYFEQGRYDEAIEHFEAALPFTPEDHLGSAHHNLGSLLELANRFEPALEHLNEALKHPVTNKANTIMTIGKVLAKQGKHEEALEKYREALNQDRNYAAIHHRRAQSLSALERHDEAIQAIDRALGLRNDPIYHDEAAMIHARSFDYETAVRHARAAYELAPNIHRVSVLGSLLLQIDKAPEAMNLFRGVLRSNPNQHGIRAKLGSALLQSGNIADGVAEFERALRSRNAQLRRAVMQDLARARHHSEVSTALRKLAQSKDREIAQLARRALQ